MTNQNFQHHYSVSHNPSEIILIGWFAAQETFFIIINIENHCVWTDVFHDTDE